MRIVCLQHVDHETPGAIADWAASRAHSLETVAPLFERYPAVDAFDLLAVLGGPMGAYEGTAYPWLGHEKRFVRETIDAGRLVLGVCLGAQLVAEAIGGSVRPSAVREVGWFPARLTSVGRASVALSVLPDEFVAGLWHGDTFDLPPGVESAAVTDGCPNQAFECLEGRVVGIQFHLEWTTRALGELARTHRDWFEAGGPFVQTESEFLSPGDALASGRSLLFDLLDRMEAAR